MMKSAARAMERWWFPVVPAERLAMLRILVGTYGLFFLLIRLPHLLSYAALPAQRFEPVGLATLLDAPLDANLYRAMLLALLPLSVAFLLGAYHRLLAPLYALLLLFVITYSNSFAMILHTDNMLVLHVLVLALSRASDALSLDARRRPHPAPDSGRYGWAIQLMCLLCALVYFIAGVAKLRASGFAFVQADSLRNYIAWGAVRKIELGSHHSPIGVALLEYTGFFTFLAAFSLGLELLAPLAMMGRRAATVLCVLLWGFHVGVLATMAIGFVYQLTFVAYAPFFRVERLLEWGPLRRRLGRPLGAPTPSAHEPLAEQMHRP